MAADDLPLLRLPRAAALERARRAAERAVDELGEALVLADLPVLGRRALSLALRHAAGAGAVLEGLAEGTLTEPEAEESPAG